MRLTQQRIQDRLPLGTTAIPALEPSIRPQIINLSQGQLIRVQIARGVRAAVFCYFDETAFDGGELVGYGHELFRDGFRGGHETVAEAVAAAEEVEEDLWVCLVE